MDLRTDEALLKALSSAADHKPTADELQHQRVSFIYGTLDDESGITKSQIQGLLDERFCI